MLKSKITHKSAIRIARLVIKYLHGGIDPRFIDVNAQIDGYLKDIGTGWNLRKGAYIDGVSCQFIGILAKDIRLNAIEKY